jgi:hypothetical protein
VAVAVVSVAVGHQVDASHQLVDVGMTGDARVEHRDGDVLAVDVHGDRAQPDRVLPSGVRGQRVVPGELGLVVVVRLLRRRVRSQGERRASESGKRQQRR